MFCSATVRSDSTCSGSQSRFLIRTSVCPLRYFPFGIIFLVAGKILDMQDPSTLGKKLGWYGITVLAGLFVHGLILLPLFYFILTRKNPFSYIRGLLQALVIALATSSRSASRRSCCELLDSCWCVQVLILS